MKTVLPVVLGVALCACAGPSGFAGGDATDVQAGDAATQPNDAAEAVPCNQPLGAPCFRDAQCASGLCLVSEVTPFGFCTRPCQTPSAPCTMPDGQPDPSAWCVDIPGGYVKLGHPELSAFCLPRCQRLDDCAVYGPGWTTCGEFAYKGNPVFPQDPIFVCQAPEAMGKVPVDPLTCEGWFDANPSNDSDVNTAKNRCLDYCDFLATCHYYPLGTDLQCCQWHCFLKLVGPSGTIDAQLEDLLTNFVNFWKGNQGTAQECQGEVEFGPPPIPDEGAPRPSDVQCGGS